ncbi:MAG: hypothetical protein FRX48_09833 [Lasallia pustulata]|uniref:Uncharacterized protein n=1 Tax=Lasallia pustulata TaxID=136370 RepID=A0A5M8PBR1_9LECA|nr:MAG: hypothetical protein FRX48_09833 [Lasallia pustulata]
MDLIEAFDKPISHRSAATAGSKLCAHLALNSYKLILAGRTKSPALIACAGRLNSNTNCAMGLASRFNSGASAQPAGSPQQQTQYQPSGPTQPQTPAQYPAIQQSWQAQPQQYQSPQQGYQQPQYGVQQPGYQQPVILSPGISNLCTTAKLSACATAVAAASERAGASSLSTKTAASAASRLIRRTQRSRHPDRPS